MLLKSMTGFGRCEAVNEECKITVEMKSVNHRYLDLSIKMPKKFNVYEAGIRMILKEYIQRGKVDIFISYEDYTQQKSIWTYLPECTISLVSPMTFPYPVCPDFRK